MFFWLLFFGCFFLVSCFVFVYLFFSWLVFFFKTKNVKNKLLKLSMLPSFHACISPVFNHPYLLGHPAFNNQLHAFDRPPPRKKIA